MLDYDSPGEDDLDEICKRHDLCYDFQGRNSLECDRRLVEELEGLNADPTNWDNSPQIADDVIYASVYLGLMRFYFKQRVKNAEFDKWLRENPEGVLPLMP